MSNQLGFNHDSTRERKNWGGGVITIQVFIEVVLPLFNRFSSASLEDSILIPAHFSLLHDAYARDFKSLKNFRVSWESHSSSHPKGPPFDSLTSYANVLHPLVGNRTTLIGWCRENQSSNWAKQKTLIRIANSWVSSGANYSGYSIILCVCLFWNTWEGGCDFEWGTRGHNIGPLSRVRSHTRVWLVVD